MIALLEVLQLLLPSIKAFIKIISDKEARKLAIKAKKSKTKRGAQNAARLIADRIHSK